MSIFIDTNIFVSFSNKRDRDHGRAKKLMDRLRKREFGTPYTSDYVFDEAVTISLLRTRRIELAVKVGKLILGSKDEGIPSLARLLRVDEKTFSEAWKNFRSGKFATLSFTDHTSLALIRSLGIDNIMSFDSDFDGLVARIC